MHDIQSKIISIQRVNIAEREYSNHRSCDQNKFIKFKSKMWINDSFARILNEYN